MAGPHSRRRSAREDGRASGAGRAGAVRGRSDAASASARAPHGADRPDPIVGQIELPGFPLRFSAFPEALPVQAPLLGQHNLEVLQNYLGYSAERVKQLEAQGVLVQKDC